jgi:hypothetical protein
MPPHSRATQPVRFGTVGKAGMSIAAALLVGQAGMASVAILERALVQIEPAPALRAAFRARLTSGSALREIAFDPHAAPEARFLVTRSVGASEELDAAVDGWRDEGQADTRLFADALRLSIAETRPVQATDSAEGNWALSFRHRISPSDGPVDHMISSRMVGQLFLDPATGRLKRIEHRIEKPIRLDNGAMLTAYRQVFRFAHSERWGVSFVSDYEVEARGGRWGVSASRTIRAAITSISFSLAGDARQELLTKP